MTRLPINTWDQMRQLTRAHQSEDAWCVMVDKGSNGRAYRSPKATVFRFYKGRVQPTAAEGSNAWYDRTFAPEIGYFDSQHFHVAYGSAGTPRERLELAAQDAIVWATERYSPQSLTKNRVGDYVPQACTPIPTDKQRAKAEAANAQKEADDE